MPRPSSLTAERRDSIERALAAGAPLSVAAASAGVTARTISRWLREGQIARRRLSAVPEPEEPSDGGLPGNDEAIHRALPSTVWPLRSSSPGAPDLLVGA